MRASTDSGADHRATLLPLFERLCRRPPRSLVYAQPGARPAEAHQCLPVPRMTFVTAGAKHIELHDGERARDLRVRAGQAIFMPPMGWTLPRYDSPRVILAVVFHRDYTRFLLSRHDARGGPRPADAFHHAPGTMRGAAAHLIQALCARARETRGGEPGEVDLQLLAALLRLARDELARSAPERGGRARATWQALREHVAEHHQRELSRESIAAAFGLHPNYVSTLFAEQGGEPFARYLTRVRMERAAELLRESGRGVGEVGAACGYPDPGYFIKAFRRFHRVTPGRFARA